MISYIIAIALLALLIALIVMIAYVVKNKKNKKNYYKYIHEPFDAVKQLRQTQAQVDAMDERDIEDCPANSGFEKVCKYNRACCKDNAVGASGCLCSNPILASCRYEYDACRRGDHPASMNNIATNFVGTQAARGDMCQTILDNCCDTGATVYNRELATGQKVMKPVAGMKPVVGDNGPICSQIGSTADQCRDNCAAAPGCKVAYYNDVAQVCDLYDSDRVKKKNANEMLASDSFKMWTRGNLSVLDADVFEGFTNLASRCLSNTGGECQHPVTIECQRLKTRCVNKYSELLGDEDAKRMCANNHKSCCQTLANVDLADKFALDGPKWGRVEVSKPGGNNINGNSRWKCDISRNVKSLGECKTRCLEDPRCKILDSNMAIFKGRSGMELSKLPDAKCVMYGSSDSNGGKGYKIVSDGKILGEKKKIGAVGSGIGQKILYEPDNIWTRRDIDELDAELDV